MIGRQLATGLAVAAALAGGAAASADTLYRFVDERGVVHFSNVPSDPRYVAVRSLGGARSFGGAQSWQAPDSRAYDDLIATEAGRHGLPPALVKAVIAAESNFDPQATSPKGALGLMQLMPSTAELLGVDDAFEVRENVRGGTRYLAAMLERYGDWSHALAAYNAGPKAVDRYQGIPPFEETREYVRRVLAYYRRYDAEFAR